MCLFRYRFNLTEVPDADLKAKFAIDNTADTININGTVIATSAGAFSSRTAVVIPAADLVVGVNTLLIEASDDGAVAGLLWEWDES